MWKLLEKGEGSAPRARRPARSIEKDEAGGGPIDALLMVPLILFFVLGLGFAAVAVLYGKFALDPSAVFLRSLWAGLPALPVFILLLNWISRALGKNISWNPMRLVAVSAVFLLSCFGVTVWLNFWLDRGPETVRRVRVMRGEERFGEPLLIVDSWRDPGGDESIPVVRALYDEVGSGLNQLKVRIRPGAFGFEWVSGYEGAYRKTTGEAGDILDRGDELYGDDDYEAAIAEYEKALALEPENGEILFILGTAQRGIGDVEAALATLERASFHSLSDAKVHDALADLCAELHEYELGLVAMNRAIDAGLADGVSYRRRAWFKGKLGDIELALADLSRGCDLGDEDSCRDRRTLLSRMQP